MNNTDLADVPVARFAKSIFNLLYFQYYYRTITYGRAKQAFL